MYLVPSLLLLLLKSAKFTSHHVISISVINFFSFLSILLNVLERTPCERLTKNSIYIFDFYIFFRGFVEKCFESDWW